MHRRTFLQLVGAATLARRAAGDEPARRTFEITTHLQIRNPTAVARAWLPTPLAAAPYQRTLGDTYRSDGASFSMVEREDGDFLAAQWPAGADPALTLVSRVETTDYTVNLDAPTVAPPPDLGAFSRYLRSTTLTPIDADSKSRAAALTRGGGTDFDRARALFAALVVKTSDALPDRDPGLAFAALARAAGMPARAVFGLRVSVEDATAAQECRAEVYLVGYGWVPVDVHDRRFGSWDMRWIAYNSAHDLKLPGSAHGTIPALTRPHGETAGVHFDGTTADAFVYTISARAI